MSFSFCFSPMRRAALFALASSFLAALAFAAGNAFSFLVFVILAAGNALLILALWYSLQAMLFSFLPFVAFGTGEGLLRYGIRIRCSKRLPVVRDSFSDAFGVKNRLLWYGRNIRYRKRPPTVRNRHAVLKNVFPDLGILRLFQIFLQLFSSTSVLRAGVGHLYIYCAQRGVPPLAARPSLRSFS